MTANGWLQIVVLLAAVAAVTVPLGGFIARVFAREHTWLDPVLRPIERVIYRLTGVDETREMSWIDYALAMLAFSLVSMLALYLQMRLQAWLPLNPQGLANVPPDLAFNTAASFTTNTNWQSYVGETTMSYLTQMAGLAYHNFVSAAVGIALAIALIRGVAGDRRGTLGNFWVDMTRAVLWVLLPFCVVGALLLVSQGVVQNFRPYDRVELVDPQGAVTHQVIAQGPVASQEVIKEWGTNGGGFFNANSAHPFENPTPLTNLLQLFGIFAISAGLTATLGRMTQDTASWLGDLGGDGGPLPGRRDRGVLGRGARQPAAGRHRPDGRRHVSGREHGRQGGPLRHRQLGAVRHGDDRCELRRRQRHARLIHAARGPGAAREHHARRGDLRRRRRRPLRHGDLRRPGRVHRRPDGRPHARVPGQEDRSVRRPDGDARRAGVSAHHSRSDRHFVGARASAPRASPTPGRMDSPRSCTPSHRAPATTAPRSPASRPTRPGTTRRSASPC